MSDRLEQFARLAASVDPSFDAELSDDMPLASLGLDSLAIAEILVAFEEDEGVEIDFTPILEGLANPTVGALIRAFESTIAKRRISELP